MFSPGILSLVQMLAKNPALLYLGFTAAMMGALVYTHFSSYNRGVEVTEVKYQKIILEEQERMLIANEAALTEAREIIKNLDSKLRSRNATILSLQTQAAMDPDAARSSVNVNGVRRINQIR